MTERSIEWAVDYDGGIANVSTDRAEAEEMVQWIRSGRLVFRIVERTKWREPESSDQAGNVSS